MVFLSISLVSYDSDCAILQQTLDSLGSSLEHAWSLAVLERVDFFLVDNGPDVSALSLLIPMVQRLEEQYDFLTCHVLTGHGNIGFGAGHNLALAQADSDFYLVLNPDVFFCGDTIFEALQAFQRSEDIGLLAPLAVDESGGNQYLCKRYPSILDLALRAFAPSFIQRIFHSRLDRYKMTELYTDGETVQQITIASGCCMFFRTAVIKRMAGFSERYFLYFEDFDLSLRCAEVARVMYAPQIRITHLGGHAARKSLTHIRMFSRSAFVFFTEHGWRLW